MLMFINPHSEHLRERQTKSVSFDSASLDKTSSGLDTGAAVGIGVGIVVFLAMCIGAGFWTWIRRRERGSSEDAFANRPRSPSYGSETGMVYSDKTKAPTNTPPMKELLNGKIPRGSRTSDLAEIKNRIASSGLYQGHNRYLAGQTHIQTEFLPHPTKLPTLELPGPRFNDSPISSGLQSPSQWSLFPKDDRPYTASSRPNTSGSRPNTSGSRRPHLPRTASSPATPNLPITNLAPTPVELMPSPAYARSEYASIHHRLSTYSALSQMPPPTPPPKSDYSSTLRQQPRPMSFQTFVAQAQGRTSHAQSRATLFSAGNRKSRRTSLKSYLGRNGLGDEGIFVATSDDPDIPFTLFRWPNDSVISGTPRSSKAWPK